MNAPAKDNHYFRSKGIRFFLNPAEKWIIQIFLILALCIFFGACKDKEQSATDDYGIFCWPSKTPCKNREYGLEFSEKVIRIEMVNGQLQAREGRMATLICCSYIQALMDTLKSFHAALTDHRLNGGEDLDKSCNISPDIRVFVNRTFDFNNMKSISFFGFSDEENSFVYYVPQFEHFEGFINELSLKYRKCCLREDVEEE